MKATNTTYYTEEQVNWIKENIDNFETIRELTNEYNKLFTPSRNYHSLRDKLSVLKIKSKMSFTNKQLDWLKQNYNIYNNIQDLTNVFNSVFSTYHSCLSINRKCSQLKLLYNNHYNEVEEQWLLENINNFKNIKELSVEFNKTFKDKRTYDSIREKCSVLKIKSLGTYTQEQIDWLKENYDKYNDFKHLYLALNKTFHSYHTYSCVRSKCYELNLKSNKPQSLPIGTERFSNYPQKTKTKIKITHNEWVSKARYVNGLTKQDKDKVVIVVDDKQAITKENTIILTKKGHQYMLANHYHKLPPRLKPLAAKNCELKALLKGE